MPAENNKLCHKTTHFTSWGSDSDTDIIISDYVAYILFENNCQEHSYTARAFVFQ